MRFVNSRSVDRYTAPPDRRPRSRVAEEGDPCTLRGLGPKLRPSWGIGRIQWMPGTGREPGEYPSRSEALGLLFEFTESEALRRHARAVEQAMLAYATWFGITDEVERERWGIVGLLHDFDYEQNPTAETHAHVGAKVLRERAYPEELVEDVASHADYMGIPRDTPRRRALYACDELTGFLGACVKVRPSKRLHDLPVDSVVRKLKDKAFARSVDRTAVYAGAEALGRPLEEHIGFLIAALLPIADELGL